MKVGKAKGKFLTQHTSNGHMNLEMRTSPHKNRRNVTQISTH